MTKADIIESVYEKVGFSKKEAAELVELVFDTLKETLERGDKVKISGFGNFQPRYKRARPGRNPQSGQPIEITARRVVKFVPSQVLKADLNDGDVAEDELSAVPWRACGSALSALRMADYRRAGFWISCPVNVRPQPIFAEV